MNPFILVWWNVMLVFALWKWNVVSGIETQVKVVWMHVWKGGMHMQRCRNILERSWTISLPLLLKSISDHKHKTEVSYNFF